MKLVTRWRRGILYKRLVDDLGTVRTVCAVQRSLREACRDNHFVNWQLAEICSDAPETGKGVAVDANARSAAAACRAWLEHVSKSSDLNVIENVPAWTNRHDRRHDAPRGNSVSG